MSLKSTSATSNTVLPTDSPALVARDIEAAFAAQQAGFTTMQELCRRALPFLKVAGKQASKAERREVPEDYEPSAEIVTRATTELHLSMTEIGKRVANFIAHHRAKGTRFKRLDLACWNWLSEKFVEKRPGQLGAVRHIASAQILTIPNRGNDE